jgi:hypothetical protein
MNKRTLKSWKTSRTNFFCRLRRMLRRKINLLRGWRRYLRTKARC